MNCEMQATNVLQQDGSRTITWYAGGLQSFREMRLGPVRRHKLVECRVDAASASWCSNKQNADNSEWENRGRCAIQIGTVLQTLYAC